MSEILDIDLERNDLSEFSAGISGSGASVKAAAALADTAFGLEIDAAVGATSNHQREITWLTDQHLRMRLHLRPISLVLGDTTARRIFALLDGLSNNMVGFEIRTPTASSGSLEMRAVVLDDTVTEQATAWAAFNNTTPLVAELHLKRADTAVAANGTLTLYFVSHETLLQAVQITALDVFDITRPIVAAVGWTNPHASDTGLLYMDEFKARNDNEEIGAAVGSMTLAEVTHDVGDLSEYDSTQVTGGSGTALEVLAAAGQVGTPYGIRINITNADTTEVWAQKQWDRYWYSRVLRFRLHIHISGVTSLADTNARRVYSTRDASNNVREAVEFRSDGGSGYEFRVLTTDDAAAMQATSWFAITNDPAHFHFIEVEVVRAATSAASDGTLKLFYNGAETPIATLSSLDIYDVTRAEAGRFEWGGSIAAADAGTIDLDAMSVRSKSREIGTAVRVTRGPLSITVGGDSVAYIEARTRKTDQVGAAPGTLVFNTYDIPPEVEGGEVLVDASWQDEAGVLARTERFFGGHITNVQLQEVTVGGAAGEPDKRVIRYTVTCADYRHEAAFLLVAGNTSQQPIEDALNSLLNPLNAATSGGYTLDADAGQTVGPYTWDYVPYPQAAAEMCRDAGFLFWIDGDKVIHAKDPDTLVANYEIHRDEPDGRWWGFDYGRAHGLIVNRVRVFGDGNRQGFAEDTPSQSIHQVRPLVFKAPQVVNQSVLDYVAGVLLASRRDPVVSGSVVSNQDRLYLGENTALYDFARKIKSQPVRIEKIDWQERPLSRWFATPSFTSEKIIGQLVPRSATGGGATQPASMALHSGPVHSPTTEKAAPTGGYIIGLTYDVAAGDIKLRLDSDNASKIYQAFRMVLRAAGNLTVTRTLGGTVDAGEDVEILGSGTPRVDVASTISGERYGGRWPIETEEKDVTLTVTGDLETAWLEVWLTDGEIEGETEHPMDGAYFGNSQVLPAGMDIQRTLWMRLDLDPAVGADGLEAGAIGTTQLADLSVSTAKLAALAVTGDKLAASSVSDGKVSSIGAAKIAESASRKWAAETGADVTGANTAASITGQGDLATKNTVAAAEIDAGAVVEAKIGTGAVTNLKYGAASITQDKIDDDAVGFDEIDTDSIYGSAFRSAVQLALADYNTDTGPDSESEWDAV